MHKKLFLVLFSVIFFSSFHLVFASLSINEIMYDLSGSDSIGGKSREWIEVFNSGNDIAIDASKWRIYDGSANRTINGEVDFSIPAGSYVIFVGDKDTFLVDHVGFSGLIYDTGMTSLNNTGATLKILDQDGNTVDSVTYTSGGGGAGDGNSLQKIGGNWISAVSTLGVINETITLPIVSTTNDNNNNSNTPVSGGSGVRVVIDESKIQTQIVGKTFGFVGVPFSLQAETLGHQSEKMFYGKYFWNFGDGDSKQIKLPDSQPVFHTYFYPGEYTISLDYYTSFYSDIPDASDQIVVKVVEANVSISKVGDGQDFFVELTNNTDYNVDLSNWILASVERSFIIPRNTILGPKKSLIISGRVSTLTFEDKNTLKLLTPQREVAFDYISANVSTRTIIKNVPVIKDTIGKTPIQDENFADLKISSGNLEANTLDSEAMDSGEFSVLPVIPMVALVLVGAGASAVYFIRKKKTGIEVGSDFEILDE